MTNHARFLKRALRERLEETRQKRAFVPLTAKQGQQAAGPGGMPVGPGGGGGAPMDPMMAGGAPPMDPMAGGGAPPMDPMAGGGAPPMDPMAGGGASPMDPMAGGGAPPGGPMDLGAMAAGLEGMPPPPGGEGLPPLEGEEAGGAEEASISGGDVEALKGIQQNTMDIVRQTLEMVGKAKPQEAGAETEQKAAEEPPPEAQPGPVTGQPGLSPDMLSGPLKLGAALRDRLKKKEAASSEELAKRLSWRNRGLRGDKAGKGSDSDKPSMDSFRKITKPRKDFGKKVRRDLRRRGW